MESNIVTMSDVTQGIKFIMEFLDEVKEKTNIEGELDYTLPKYIYRGVDCFYTYDGERITHPTSGQVLDDHIRSGLSVRLDIISCKNGRITSYPRKKEERRKEILGDAYLRENYINTLQDLVRNARKYHPNRYISTMSDLDILADIQHNGGATCLVDFSKNILTSLWFACKDGFDADGIIYCYDIMEDMIMNDSLTYIRPEDEHQSIETLIKQTYKETNVTSDSLARFCLWEPSPKNTRILRQDSIFLFGIEPFIVRKHSVKAILIPAERKKMILYALNGLFNISGKTIYNDYIGYAQMNRKNVPCEKMNDTSYHRGYVNMIKGNYGTALEFFKLWEGGEIRKGNNINERRKVELYFSLAVCYKNLKRKEGKIRYYDNAIAEYQKSIDTIMPIIKNDNTNIKEKSYLIKKMTRAYSGIIDMLYVMKKYNEAIEVCEKLIFLMNDGVLKDEEDLLNLKYCKLASMELLNLELLTIKAKKISVERTLELEEKLKKQMEEFIRMAEVDRKEYSYFDELLFVYYKLIFDILVITNKENLKDCQHRLKIWKEKLRNNADDIGPNKYEGYILWNFEEIKELIDEYQDEDDYPRKKYLQYATAYAISFRDEFEMQSWGIDSNI